MSSKIRIGLFGFGCVGRGLYDILSHNTTEFQVEKVCVRQRYKHRGPDSSLFTFDPKEILDDPAIDIVVELIDDHETAYSLASEALQRGKAVVSANKRMIAGKLDELLSLQQQHSAPFLYEAACCASIPIIRTLENYYCGGAVHGIEGIVNGTTNYILTRMLHEGLSFEEALTLAQQHGFAESDPSMDIEAFDAKFKLCLLATHAFGVVLPVDKVFNYGIGTIAQEDFVYARAHNSTIKLVARALHDDGKLSAAVLPAFLPSGHSLAAVGNEYNGVLVHTPYSDAQFFHGRGAGGHPTASAVLADISAAAAHYRYTYGKTRAQSKPEFTNDVAVDVYCRYGDTDVVRELPFDSVDRRYSSKSHNYVTGRVQLEALSTYNGVRNKDVFVGIIPTGL